jgi:hypothetical protein
LDFGRKNDGPGGTGRLVRICGYEEWHLGENGFDRQLTRHFDSADYERQLKAADITPAR